MIPRKDSWKELLQIMKCLLLCQDVKGLTCLYLFDTHKTSNLSLWLSEEKSLALPSYLSSLINQKKKNVKATRRRGRELREPMGRIGVLIPHNTMLLCHYCVTHQWSTHLPSVHLHCTHCARRWGFTHKCMLILILEF